MNPWGNTTFIPVRWINPLVAREGCFQHFICVLGTQKVTTYKQFQVLKGISGPLNHIIKIQSSFWLQAASCHTLECYSNIPWESSQVVKINKRCNGKNKFGGIMNPLSRRDVKAHATTSCCWQVTKVSNTETCERQESRVQYPTSPVTARQPAT